jgi:PAS domain S-box-containing protein
MFECLNRLSVRNRIWSIVLIFVCSIVLVSTVDIKILRETLNQEKESTIRQLVESGYSVLAHYEELERSGILSREAAQAGAIGTIKYMRYNGKEYFWINDDKVPSRMVMHPILPELNGQVLVGERFNCATSLRSGSDGPFVPTDGKMNLIQAFLQATAEKGDGYVTYQWSKSTSISAVNQEKFPKLSYVKKFAPWGWIIGSGIYIDDIDAAVKARATQNLLMLLGVSAALLLLAGLIARSITHPLRITMNTMHGIAQGDAGLDQRLAITGHSEIAQLASHFNEMLDHIQARDQALLKHQEDLENVVSTRTRSLREANLMLDAELLERKRVEKVINESKRRMHALLDATNESVLLLAPDGKILEINAFAAGRFGNTPQKMCGTDFFAYMPEKLAEKRRAMLRFVEDTREAVHFHDHRGSIFFENSIYPVKNENGGVESVAVYAKDVTEQHRIKLDEELFSQLGTMLMRWGVDSKSLAQIFCDGVLPLYNLRAAWIAVSGLKGQLSLLAASEGIAPSAVEHIHGSGNGAPQCLPVTSVISSGQREVLTLARLGCPLCTETARAIGASEVILLPLVLHGENWGVLALYGEEPNQFTDGLLQQRQIATANRLAMTLESALRQESLALFDLALAEVGNAVMITDAEAKIVWVNRSFTVLSGYTSDELLRHDAELMNSGLQGAEFFQDFWQTISTGHMWRGDIVNRRKDGSLYTANEMVTPLFNIDGKVSHYVAILEDISERKRQEKALQENFERLRILNEQLENAQNQLLQSEKMASIGQLAAGVAHEINNPIGFVSSNLGTLKAYVDQLLAIIQAYGKADPLLAGQPEINAAIETLKVKADLEFLRDDIQLLLNESRDGIARVTKIVQDLKDFSRIDRADWGTSNLEQGMDSTLNIVWNEIKYKADVIKEYGGIPSVECLGSQLNQVFMNLLVNAAQAIESHGTITIRTGTTGSNVWVEIADTGRGISPENQKRIFEPFFTTKPVGKGTGLGLSLAYSIIEKHHGQLSVVSKIDSGSCFRIEIPCVQPHGQLTDNVPESTDGF